MSHAGPHNLNLTNQQHVKHSLITLNVSLTIQDKEEHTAWYRAHDESIVLFQEQHLF